MPLGALKCRVAGGGGEPELKEGILGAVGEVLGGCVRGGGGGRESDLVPDLAKGMGTRAPPLPPD